MNTVFISKKSFSRIFFALFFILTTIFPVHAEYQNYSPQDKMKSGFWETKTRKFQINQTLRYGITSTVIFLTITGLIFFLNRKSPYNKVYLSLGSNMGDRKKNILEAIALLKQKKIFPIKKSSWYETEPVGFNDQAWFYNMVIEAKTVLSPKQILEKIQEIESELGRARKIRFGPRTIDIDILFYNDLLYHEKDLEIPHPRLHERKFVLIPLVEISPEFIHPEFKKNIAQLVKECKDRSEIKKIS